MKIVLFELRKNILRKVVVIPAILLLCLNMIAIYVSWKYTDDAFTNEVNVYNSSAGQWRYHKELHQKFDGVITEKKQDEIIRLYNGLKEKIARGDYERGYTEEAETGYIFGDYSLVESNFYFPLKYFVSYREKNDEIVDRAKENAAFYRQTGNRYEREKNQYIADRYAGRMLSEFYDTTGWKKLFRYDFSDVVLIILMFLCILPLFQQERISGMENIILGTKKGRKWYLAGKYLSVIIGIVAFSTIAAGVNYLTFDVIYGLDGAAMPLYALEDFQYTPFNLSLLQAYLAMQGLKCLALVVTGTWFCFLSGISRNTMASFVVFLVITAAALYASGFICSDNRNRILWAVASPFSLLKSDTIFQSLYDMNIGGSFCHRIVVCIFVQLIIEAVWILLSYGTYRHFNKKRRPGDKRCLGMRYTNCL